MKRGIIPVFVPHKGCPNDCVFCNQKRITGITVSDIFNEAVESAQIDELVAGVLHQFDSLELAFFGGSFTAIPRPEMLFYLKKASELKEKGVVDKIRLSTRPDQIDASIIQLLVMHGVDIVELGVQSLDDEVLRRSKRGCTLADVEQAACLIKNAGIELGFQLMMGLPGDTEEKSIATAKTVALFKNKPDFARLYPALVIEDTEMADLFRAGSYQPFSLEQAVRVSAAMVEILVEANIPVIRIGLQPTENMVLGKDILAGPFHPSFRQMVDTQLMLEILKHEIGELIRQNESVVKDLIESVEISVPRKHMSTVKGLSKSGELALQQWLHHELQQFQCEGVVSLRIKQKESACQGDDESLDIRLTPSMVERNVAIPKWKQS